MKESLRGIIGAASTLLLIGLFVVAVAPASAGEVDLKIKALEQELTQLKVEQEEATEASRAAAAKMPTFRYRPGSGLLIGAADKSWSINFRYRFHMHMYNYTDGNDSDGFTTTDLFVRRNRWRQIMCWDGCFYELESALDLDTGDIATTQSLGLYFHFEKMNPVLPTLWVTDKGGQSLSYVVRSSSSSARVEIGRDVLDDGLKITLSTRQIGIGWINRPIGQGDFLLSLQAQVGTDKNNKSTTDRKQLALKAGMRPWRKSKNKWLKGIKFGIGLQTTSFDARSSRSASVALRTMERIGRIRVFEAETIGKGSHIYFEEGFEWKIGPYLFVVSGGQNRYESKSNSSGSGHRGQFIQFANELWLWSPKGFLTGAPNKAGSLQLGYRFLRADAQCGSGNPGCSSSNQMNRNHYYVNEVNLWYYIRNKLSVGVWLMDNNAANVPTDLQTSIKCSNNSSTTAGKSCDWQSVNLGLRMDW